MVQNKLFLFSSLVVLVLVMACAGPGATPTPAPTTAPTPTTLPALSATLIPIALPEEEITCGTGERLTVFSVGEKDGFDSDPDAPPASYSATLLARYGFGSYQPLDTDGIFGHTFAGLPDNITSAQLEINIRPSASSNSPNNQLYLFFTPSEPWVWGEYLGTFSTSINGLLPNPWNTANYASGNVFIFDLGNIPTPGSPGKTPSISSDLVLYMNQYNVLDVVSWGSPVDYLKLSVCNTSGEAPPAPDLAISKSQPFFIPYGEGEVGSYRIVVENEGNATASGPILVVDTLPLGFTFLSTTTPSWTCTVTQPVTDPATDQEIVECVRPAGLPTGVSITLIIEVSAHPLFTQAPYLNCAEVQHPDDLFPPNNESCTETAFLVSNAAWAAAPPTYPACLPSDPRTIFGVGELDDFDPDPDMPPAAPDPGLIYTAGAFGVEGFDTPNTAAYFAHTFSGLPADISSAWLEIRLRPDVNPFNNPEDMRLMTIGQIRPYGWWSHLDFQGLIPGSWDPANYPQGHTLLLDLGALPPSSQPPTDSDLIPGMRYSRTLDILIRGNLAVDYIALTVCTTTTPGPIAVATLAPVVRSTATPTPTPVTFATRVPAVVTTATPTPVPSPTPFPTATPTVEPKPTATRVPEATPTSTPTRENPDLAIEKFLNSEFHYGQSGSYTFQIGNVGTGTASSPIQLVDVLPDGFTFDSYSDPYTTDWACTASGQQVTCVYTGPDISPGGFLPALIINVTIASVEKFPAGSDAVDNCAQVQHPDDVNPGNDQSCVSTIITQSGAAG